MTKIYKMVIVLFAYCSQVLESVYIQSTNVIIFNFTII